MKKLVLLVAVAALWGCNPGPEAKLEQARERQAKIDEINRSKADIVQGVCRQSPGDPMCQDAKPH